jgi:DNA topoisomerase VI subunit B
MMDLNKLRDKLDMALDKETADSLNEWLNNKRNMTDEQIARVQLVSVLDNIKSIMHELTIGELDELIDEVTRLYEHYNSITDVRNGEKPE